MPEALLATQPGNAGLSVQGLSCQLQICNLGWPAGPALAALLQSVGVGVTRALSSFSSSSCLWQGDPEVTDMVAQPGTMQAEPAEMPQLCSESTHRA